MPGAWHGLGVRVKGFDLDNDNTAIIFLTREHNVINIWSGSPSGG